MNVVGYEMDLSFMREYMDGLVQRIAKRRSLEWVNEVAARHKVEYGYSAPC
jgi:hypothetical protein